MKPPMILQELSERLGISVSQISRALNHKGRVAPATRERILRAVREAGYRNRSSRHSGRFVLIPGIIHDIYRDLIDGFQREIEARSGRLVLMDAAGAKLLDEFMVDAVIAVDAPPAVLAELRRRRMPVVAAGVYADSAEAVVTLDHDAVLDRIASRLPEMNRHKLLAVFPGSGETAAIRCRREAVTELVLPVGQWLTLPERPELEDHDAVLIAGGWKKAALLALCRRRRPDLAMMFYHSTDFISGVDTVSAEDGWYVDWRALAAAVLDAALAGPEASPVPRRLEPLLRKIGPPPYKR